MSQNHSNQGGGAECRAILVYMMRSGCWADFVPRPGSLNWTYELKVFCRPASGGSRTQVSNKNCGSHFKTLESHLDPGGEIFQQKKQKKNLALIWSKRSDLQAFPLIRWNAAWWSVWLAAGCLSDPFNTSESHFGQIKQCCASLSNAWKTYAVRVLMRVCEWVCV